MPQSAPLKNLHNTKRISKAKSISVSVMAKANRLAILHEGDVMISENGLDVLQFRCKAGHNFMKSVDDLSDIPDLTRKSSYCTMASSSANSSDDECTSDRSDQSGSWCPKCEAFYRSCKDTAYSCGFRLQGKLYADSLSFECVAKGHVTAISQSKRINGFVSCSACRKEDREQVKASQKLAEEEQREECARQQKKLFADAKAKMDEELKSSGNYYASNQHCD